MTWSSGASGAWSSSSSPRIAGPLVGWRAWRVVAGPGGVRLRSAVFDETWLPRVPAAAACPSGHDPPAPGCACGLYAVRVPADAVRYLVGRDEPDVVHRVLGEVALWGVTVEAERGWRAAYAAPRRILVPAGRTDGRPVAAAELAAVLARDYGIAADVVAAAEPSPLARALAA